VCDDRIERLIVDSLARFVEGQVIVAISPEVYVLAQQTRNLFRLRSGDGENIRDDSFRSRPNLRHINSKELCERWANANVNRQTKSFPQGSKYCIRFNQLKTVLVFPESSHAEESCFKRHCIVSFLSQRPLQQEPFR
jgi:hypothetical protein